MDSILAIDVGTQSLRKGSRFLTPLKSSPEIRLKSMLRFSGMPWFKPAVN
jgi:hypothetical protein